MRSVELQSTRRVSLCLVACLAAIVPGSASWARDVDKAAAARQPQDVPAEKSTDDEGDDEVIALRVERHAGDAPHRLRGRDARLQLIVTAELADGASRDWTHNARFVVDRTDIVEVDASGLVTPRGEGTVTVTANDGAGHEAQAQIEVLDFNEDQPVSFPGQVVPLFTKLGCNGGGCHGKSSGQNGFRLSLLGFEPRADYEHLVKESRGRRVFPAAPEQSLLLEKALNAVPHGGGQRLERDGHEYRLLRRWIQQGMPYGTGQEPEVVSIEVLPQDRRLPPSASQQLSVLARYSDGSTEDVTRAAQYESNDSQMAEVSPAGLVRLGDAVGDVAVMARYQGHVTVFQAAIPLADQAGATPIEWPEPRNVVDEAVFAKLRSLGIPPSPTCDDATFLRRATLDIAGRIPTLAETQAFQSDNRDGRRDALIERLLASDDYAEFFAGKWNAILRNRRSNSNYQFGTVAFHQWIRDSLAANKPYDDFVRQIVTASGSIASNPPVAWYREVSDATQRLEDAAQLFLGQRIQCARCHHHPFEKWSQSDYTQMAAFFSLVAQKPGENKSEPVFVTNVGTATARHPQTGETLRPAGLDGEVLEIAATEDPRRRLVDWMVESENPFFARALVNRYWKHFMGRGLVEPEDDLRVTNPPSNPQLLDALAESFVASGHDLKALVRLICQSRVYGLSSDPLPRNLGDRRSYSRFYPKRLHAEVLLDAVDTMTQSPTRFAGLPPGTRAVALPDSSYASYFLTVFGRPESTTACECERSQDANLAQSLHLLNSEEMLGKLSADGGRAARLAAEAERSHEEKVQELFLTAFSRPPSEDESQAAVDYVTAASDVRHAYEDLIWSLVNSKEFLFNH